LISIRHHNGHAGRLPQNHISSSLCAKRHDNISPSRSLGLPTCDQAASKKFIAEDLHDTAGDPLLKTLETVVVSVSVVQPPPKTKEKKAKKAVIAPDVPDEPLLHILLHDTVLFPEGGGQPTDTGILTTTADNRDWEVIQVKRDGGHAVHYVRLHDQSVDAGLLAFTPGAKVTVSFGKQGFDRRYDHVSLSYFYKI